MAGTLWPDLIDGRKRRASEVEQKFDWLEGGLTPMLDGSQTDAVYDLGTTTARWNNLYFMKGMAQNGALTSPAWSFRAESTSGFYLNGSNDMRFAVAADVIATPRTPLAFGMNNAASVCVAFFAANIQSISFNSMTLYGFSGNNSPNMSFEGAHSVTGAALVQPKIDFFDYNLMTAASLGTVCVPHNANQMNLGNASLYWNVLNYKTITDRGCLGWFDLGVEMPDGSVFSDLESICAIQKHPTKQTIYGVPMLDYKSFPSVAYKKATHRVGKADVECPRDENDEPYEIKKGVRVPTADGIEMTSMFSIMLGALREIQRRIVKIEEHYGLR